MSNTENTTPRLLRDKAAAKQCGISPSYWWRKVREKKIPQPIRLGSKISVWPSAIVDEIATNPRKYLSSEEA